jgi:hypothetical protein
MSVAVGAFGNSASDFRAPIVARLLATPYAERAPAVETLGLALGMMPFGSFANLTPAERKLLADRQRRRWASGLIARLSDRGAASLPLLLELLEDRKTRGPARQALCVLGPAAGPVLAQVASRMTETERAHDYKWSLTLARMGEPVERLHSNSQSDAELHQQLRYDLAEPVIAWRC